MIKLGVDDVRELAPAEYDYHLEASEGTVRRAADLREYRDAPPPIVDILRGNAEAAIAVERDSATRLQIALQGAMRQRIKGLFGHGRAAVTLRRDETPRDHDRVSGLIGYRSVICGAGISGKCLAAAYRD